MFTDRFAGFYELCQKYKKGIFRTSEAFDDVVVNIFKPELLEVKVLFSSDYFTIFLNLKSIVYNNF